jgi:outer membrane PBP1 activator LpoA protein
MHVSRLLAVALTVALLGACAGPRISPEQQAALEAPARALEARGAWREAGVAWQQAATAQGDGLLAPLFRLNAADAFLRAGDGAGAAVVAGDLPAELPPPLGLRRALVLADAALLSGNVTDALRRVGPAVTSTDRGLLARYRRIRSDALALSGDPLGAARERALRDSLLDSAEERYRNHQRTWELLDQVPVEQLQAQPLLPPQVDSGWMELASIARRHALDADALDAAIAEWSARYPGHPAGEQIVPELVERVRADARPPSTVALLLPRQGPFAGAADAVRDGFMAAWLADAPNPDRPGLLVRDSTEGDVALTYASALAEGAEFVVGPLAREAVNALLTDADLAVTTLMLNYPSIDPAALQHAGQPATLASADPMPGAVDASAATTPTVAPADPAPGTVDASAAATPAVAPADPAPGAVDASAAPSPPTAAAGLAGFPGPGMPVSAAAPRDLSRVFHFALSPEDEAARAADFAYARGGRQAAVLAPAGQWGERVHEAFAERWRSRGGVVAEAEFFGADAGDLSEAVERLLNIDDSKQRARALRATLARKFEHEPEPRSDLDVIFMAAFPQAARQLKPLLLFHRAGDVTVVATSHAYSGAPDPQQDQDIEGTVFGDMPWLLSPDTHALPAQVTRAWPAASGAAGRLYAFGADAYALIARLRELRTTPGAEFPGLTGRLSLAPGHRIRRDLEWARIEEGVPAVLDPGVALR